MPGVGTDDGRMFGGARVAELERLGPQHHGGQPPLGRPLASGGIGGRLALGPLDGQAGLIDHRHQHHELGGVGAAVCSGWPTEATPSMSPVAPRRARSSMSSGCQASGSEAADAAGVQKTGSSSHSYAPRGARLPPAGSARRGEQLLPIAPWAGGPSGVCRARLLVALDEDGAEPLAGVVEQVDRHHGVTWGWRRVGSTVGMGRLRRRPPDDVAAGAYGEARMPSAPQPRRRSRPASMPGGGSRARRPARMPCGTGPTDAERQRGPKPPCAPRATPQPPPGAWRLMHT